MALVIGNCELQRSRLIWALGHNCDCNANLVNQDYMLNLIEISAIQNHISSNFVL